MKSADNIDYFFLFTNFHGIFHRIANTGMSASCDDNQSFWRFKYKRRIIQNKIVLFSIRIMNFSDGIFRLKVHRSFNFSEESQV